MKSHMKQCFMQHLFVFCLFFVTLIESGCGNKLYDTSWEHGHSQSRFSSSGLSPDVKNTKSRGHTRALNLAVTLGVQWNAVDARVTLPGVVYLSPAEVLNKVAISLTGLPPPAVLRARWQDAPSTKENLMAAAREAFQAATWDNDLNRPNVDFQQWLLAYHANIFKVKIPRNLGLCSFCWWKPKIFDAFVAENKEYLRRFPDRYNKDYLWGGSDFEVPQSTEKTPFDYPYYLFELEPAMLATALVINHRPYSDVVSTSLTARSNTLNGIAEAFPRFQITDPVPVAGATYPVNHWTGDWFLTSRYRGNDNIHAGVLTTMAYLLSYPRERTWVNKAIYQNVLCHDIQPVANDSQIPFEFHREIDARPLDKDGCKGCHFVIDGLANMRDHFPTYLEKRLAKWSDEYKYPVHFSELYKGHDPADVQRLNKDLGGNYQDFPVTQYLLDADGKSFLPIHSFAEMGQTLSAHKWFAQCAVKNAFENIYGRSPQSNDAKLVEKVSGSFEQSGFQFMDLLRDLVLQDEFMYRQDDEAASAGGLQ